MLKYRYSNIPVTDFVNCLFFNSVGKILKPKEVAIATVEGTLTNEEIVYIPRRAKFQMAISA